MGGGAIVRGYCGIALLGTKFPSNVGTVLRSAHCFGADFLATIGARYVRRQATDTTAAERHVPLFHFGNVEAFMASLPSTAQVVAIEVDGVADLSSFQHPERAVYLLGAEDRTLPWNDKWKRVRIPTKLCLNLAVAASIVLYDREAKFRSSKSSAAGPESVCSVADQDAGSAGVGLR
jgi:tRNA(Leu) C34 or U34 (ribose-2'-O)-methylase TrmL